MKDGFSQSNGKLKHCIYLRTQNDFNSDIEGNEYKWTVKILNDTHFIGVGLADKNVVINNKNKFFSKNKEFYNGVFCLYSIYQPERNGNQIHPWHPRHDILNKYVVNFPPFSIGQKITMIYNTIYKSLIFVAKYKNKKNLNTYRMKDVVSVGSIGRTTLTPCIIFYYPGDEVQISKIEAKAQK